MPTYDLKCESNHLWTVMAKNQQEAETCLCPNCGKAGKRQWSPLADTRVLTKSVSDEDARVAMKLKRYHERPDIASKIRSGELSVAERGPLEFRPALPKRFY